MCCVGQALKLTRLLKIVELAAWKACTTTSTSSNLIYSSSCDLGSKWRRGRLSRISNIGGISIGIGTGNSSSSLLEILIEANEYSLALALLCSALFTLCMCNPPPPPLPPPHKHDGHYPKWLLRYNKLLIYCCCSLLLLNPIFSAKKLCRMSALCKSANLLVVHCTE